MATITTAELATALDTTPRELRKFLRSDDSGIEGVGKGKRYSLPGTKREVAALQKRYTAWAASQAEAKAARKAALEAAEAEIPTAPEETDADTEGEPTDEALAAIELED